MPSLTGKTVVITRPAHQSEHLSQLIESLGGKTLIFPTLEILPVTDQDRLLTAIAKLEQYQTVIFVSANAVNYAQALLVQPFPAIPVIAIGPGTARALQAHQVPVKAIPQSHDSHGILALTALQNIHGKKIAIFCGENTRPTLKNALTARGAIVDEIVCYRRRCPQTDALSALNQWQKHSVTTIISTSQESLANFWQLFAKIASDWLLHTQLVVISPAMAEQAKQIGFQSIIIATGASDEAICAALQI